MRWIFISLICVNVGYFAFDYFSNEAEVVQVSVDRNVREQELSGLKLLSELEGHELEVNVVASSVAPLQENESGVSSDLPPREEADPLCTLVGPFSEEEEAEDVIENLQALEVVATLEGVEVPEGASYWVYLAPEESRKSALRRLKELQAKNIDSYVIPKGELANGISFGVFSRKALADQRLKDMVGRGYAVSIYEMKRTRREIWVMLASEEANKVAEEFWLKLGVGKEFLEKRKNFCLGVAISSNHL